MMLNIDSSANYVNPLLQKWKISSRPVEVGRRKKVKGEEKQTQKFLQPPKNHSTKLLPAGQELNAK